MRLVFFGSGAFAIPTLQFLAASGRELVAVVTQPRVQLAAEGESPPLQSTRRRKN